MGLICKKVYAPIIYGYAAACIGVIVYYVIWGADAGFGAFTSGLAGFNSADHPLMTGSGNFGTRLLGNILLGLPAAICLWGLYFTAKHTFKKDGVKKFLSAVLSLFTRWHKHLLCAHDEHAFKAEYRQIVGRPGRLSR
ncbi:MAG: hypothetical protein L6V88_01000 [Anaerotruncus sp.]|nr:MAG: hypothetical protein L6V88_01000 [Anaerotruncus sp.]